MQCIECQTTESKKWYKAARLCNACYQKVYYLLNRERLIEQADDWRKNNPERYRANRRKIDRRKYHISTLDQRRERWRQRKTKMSDTEKNKRKQYAKDYYYEHRNTIAEHQKIYRQKNKNKRDAHKAIELAIRQDKLPHVSTQKCFLCDLTASVYHHWSYKKEFWFNVLPLCIRCHGHVHSV